MAKKTVSDIDVKGKRVLMRGVTSMSHSKGGRITDDRARRAGIADDQEIVLDRGGKLILMSHLGRPKGGPEVKFSWEAGGRSTELNCCIRP